MEKRLSRNAVEETLTEIEIYLMRKFGSKAAEDDMYPLHYYINSGRATAHFLKLLINAKPFMIARLLHKDGTYEEIMRRVKRYLGYVPSGL